MYAMSIEVEVWVINVQPRLKSGYVKLIADKVLICNVNYGQSQDMQCRLRSKLKHEMLISFEVWICNFDCGQSRVMKCRL